MYRLPLIGVTACSRQIGLHAYHISGDPYVHAVAVPAKGMPVILPSPADDLEPSDILDGLGSTLFTSDLSNIEPQPCPVPVAASNSAHDSARDIRPAPSIGSVVVAAMTLPGSGRCAEGGKAFAFRGATAP
jgi:putative glutamine amidotransferase